MANSNPAPLLIALPSGLVTSGVVAWATRLVNALASRGRFAGLILHAPAKGYRPLDVALHYGVRVYDLSDLPPLESANGDLSPFIPRYRDAIHDLAIASGQPVVVSPNLLGDCYAIIAAISMVEPEVQRVVGWAHVDLPYELAVLKHFEPMLSRVVGCSTLLADKVRRVAADAGRRVYHVPYGVPVPEIPRDQFNSARPLRLIYSGRIEQDVKRVGALVALSDELNNRGIPHSLAILGDGPASGEIDAACASRRSITRLPAMSSERVLDILARQDVFVLASRVEGLSIALLEAMAAGCVPVVARTRSGSDEAIEDGVNGRIVDWETICDVQDQGTLGRLLADAVCGIVAKGIAGFSLAARRSSRERFSIEAHVDRVAGLIDEVIEEAPRTWPAFRPCAFTSPAVGSLGSGTVPADAPARLRELLRNLAGRRIVLHGTGRHTLELAGTIAEFPGAVVGFTDDDPTRHGQVLLGLPVVAPDSAPALGASDVVISSFINQPDIWSRRGVYEKRGLGVHRLYPEAA